MLRTYNSPELALFSRLYLEDSWTGGRYELLCSNYTTQWLSHFLPTTSAVCLSGQLYWCASGCLRLSMAIGFVGSFPAFVKFSTSIVALSARIWASSRAVLRIMLEFDGTLIVLRILE
jgi:hypothetical protein